MDGAKSAAPRRQRNAVGTDIVRWIETARLLSLLPKPGGLEKGLKKKSEERQKTDPDE